MTTTKKKEEENDLINKEPKKEKVEKIDSIKDDHIEDKNPFALPSEVSEEELNDILDQDGLIIAKSAKVVKLKSKISSGLENSIIDKNDEKITQRDGKSIHELRKKVGGRWKKKGHKIFVGLIVVGVLSLLLLSIGAAWILGYKNNAPSIDELIMEPSESSIVYARDGETELFRMFGEENRKYANLDQIPEHMQLAMVALEQNNFYNEELPWRNLIGAIAKCALSAGGECRGASGITQQLVKNVTGDSSSSLDRKMRELFTAKKMLDERTNDQILEKYLNWVSFGKNIYGVEVAAQSYFGKRINDVTVVESCYLAAMPQQPTVFYNGVYARNKIESLEYGNWEKLNDRKDTCLNNLAKYDIKGDGIFIKTEEELEALKKEEVTFIARNTNRKYPHWEDYVRAEIKKNDLISEKDLYTKGYKIVTTLDPKIQDQMEVIWKENDRALPAHGANNSAGVVLDGPTGEIVAMIGSRDYNNEEIDGQVNITTSGQAPGSSFKPYVYATAFSKGFHPSTVLIDRKTDFGGGYSPNNVDMSQRGLMTMRYGLQNSLNVPAIKTTFLAAGDTYNGTKGIQEVITFSKNLGLEYPNGDCPYLSTALGACDVTMLSHATAMNTLAQDGDLRTATPFISIELQKSNVSEDEKKLLEEENKRLRERLKEKYPRENNRVDPIIARQITNVLSDYQLRGFGQGVLTIPGWEGTITSKTGTATNDKNMPTDMWTVGYTPYYTVTVWSGNTDNKASYAGAFGTNTSGPIWHDAMTYLHKDKVKKTWSTNGMSRQKVFCPEGTKGGSRCGNELLTQKQSQKLKEMGARIVKAGYNPFRDDAFGFRGEIVPQNVLISRIDNKLVKTGQLPEAYTESQACINYTSAFPQSERWLSPVEGFVKTLSGTEDKPKEIPASLTPCPAPDDYSEDTITQEDTIPNIEIIGLASNSTIANSVAITATPNVDVLVIESIKMTIDGMQVANFAGNILTFNAGEYGINGENKNVTISVIDIFGVQNDWNFENVDFDFDPIEMSKQETQTATITCQEVEMEIGQTTTCTFQLPALRQFPIDGISMYIGDNTEGSICTYDTETTITCNDIPTTLNTANDTTPVFVQIGGGDTAINESITIKLTDPLGPDPDPDPDSFFDLSNIIWWK